MRYFIKLNNHTSIHTYDENEVEKVMKYMKSHFKDLEVIKEVDAKEIQKILNDGTHVKSDKTSVFNIEYDGRDLAGFDKDGTKIYRSSKKTQTFYAMSREEAVYHARKYLEEEFK